MKYKCVGDKNQTWQKQKTRTQIKENKDAKKLMIIKTVDLYVKLSWYIFMVLELLLPGYCALLAQIL